VALHTKTRKHLAMARERVGVLGKAIFVECKFESCFFLERLIQKDQAPPKKPIAAPARIQRPTPPRKITSAPSVSILCLKSNRLILLLAYASSLLYLILAIVLCHLPLLLRLLHHRLAKLLN
jgi:hypothetical protein